MGLVYSYKLKDLKDFELRNNKSILDMIKDISFSNMVDLVSLANPDISKDDICDSLDEYLQEHNIKDLYSEIREALLGDNKNNDSKKDGDINDYKNITELFQKLSLNLRKYDDIGFSEYWNMTSNDVFFEYEILEDKVIDAEQEKLDIGHLQAAFVGQLLAGKLPNEAPKIKKENFDDNIDNPDDLDDNALSSLFALNALKKRVNGGNSDGES